MRSGIFSLIAGLLVLTGRLCADVPSPMNPALVQAHQAALHLVRPVEGGDSAWELYNPANGLSARLDGSGMSVQVEVRQSGATTERPSFRWDTVRMGRGDDLKPVGKGEPVVEGAGTNRFEIHRPEFVEWFVNHPGGLEHGYTLNTRPEGGAPSDPLRIDLKLTGDLTARVSSDGGTVILESASGRETLRYDKLKAWDATGRTLVARMVETPAGLAFEVDDAGASYPLTIDPMFTQSAYLKASNSESGDLFGASVAIDGDTAVVGAPDEDGINSNSGAAYVYKLTGGTWTEQGYLKASNAQVDNRFGWSVGISGDSIVVGAPGENGNANSSGAAYVFIRSGNTWTQQAYLKASNIGDGDRFGSAVSISEDSVLVGAPGEDSNGTAPTNNSAESAGAAYVFKRTGVNWAQQAYLKAVNVDAGDDFGRAVALGADTAVVGAPREDGSAMGSNGTVDNGKSESGATYVFLRNGTTWSQQAYLKASNTDSFDRFGEAVSISGETLAVGAKNEDGFSMDVNGDDTLNGPPGSIGAESGAAYVFVRNGSAWSQQAYFKASNPGELDNFGQSLCVSGNVLVVGAANESSDATGVNGNAANDDALSSGAAYVYLRDNGTWTREAYLKASNTQAFDYFGKSVAVSGANFIVGASEEDSASNGVDGNEGDESASQAGAAYVFLGEGDEFGVRELWGAGPELSSNETGDLPAEQDGVNATSTSWSYGTRSTFLGTALTVFTAGQHGNGIGHTDVDGWAPGAAVLVNKGNAPAILDLAGETTIPVLPGQIIVKPTAGQYPVVRWTAPEAGTYNFAARWVDLDGSVGNGAAAHVVVNGVEIFGELSGFSEISEPTYSGLAWENGRGAAMPPQSYPLEAGDTVDFLVGPNGDASGDLTAFNAVVCRAPSVTISAPANVTVGSPVDVTLALGPGTDLLGAALRVNGEPVATDLTAPFEFTVSNLTPGDHHLQVESISTERVIGASNVVLVTVDALPPAPGLFSFASEAAESSAEGSVYDAIVSGFWDESDIWRRRGDNAQGVPGPNDVAVLGRSVQVSLRSDVTVAKGYCQGRIRGDDPMNNRQLTVTEHFSIDGLIADLTLVNPVGGLITNVKGAAFFENVDLVNNGRMYLTSSLYSTESTLESSGDFTLVNRPGSAGPIRFNLGSANMSGTYSIGPGAGMQVGTMVAAGAGNLLPTLGHGLIGQDGGTLIGQDGGTLIGQDGGTVIARDGASLVGNDGASLVGQDGGTLIGNDSAGLIGNDSAGLISDNGAILVGNDGASLAQTAAAGVISSGSSTFTGGTLGGSGNLVGNVTNSGAIFRPGSSPGVIYVRGSYTQEEGGTLFLEIGGTSIENPREYDQLLISGDAILGGELIVDIINGYVPVTGQAVPALFFNTRTGTFSRISSNASISFGPNGMELEADGPLGGGPPTLSISAAPGRVKEGKSASFVISAPPGTARPVTVAYLMSGKAKSGDYLLQPRTIVIPAGRNSATVRLVAKKDKATEKVESATMTLQPRSGYLLSPRNATTISILNVKAKPKKK